jgi:hypothetical protein
MSMRMRLPAALLLAALTTAACSAGGTTPTSPSDGGTAAPSAVVDGIAHPTGPTDIVLRLDEGGGFVPVEWMAAHIPQFTLYGDGTVVYVDGSVLQEPRPDGVSVNPPLRTAKLTEAQVQDLLAYAIRDGGLGVAKAEYQNPLIADAPTAVFTLNADGAEKRVAVVALGMEDMEPNADTAVKQALAELGARLKDFESFAGGGAGQYEAAAYEGILIRQEGLEGVQVRDWPWTDLTPADFAFPDDPNMLQQGRATLTPEQAAALGIEGFENGISSGVYVRDESGAVSSFVLRPQLPDEAAA